MGSAFGLVLGGGGSAGIAWEIGFLSALEDVGASVLGADTAIGTSAGSIVAAQVFGGRALPDLFVACQTVSAAPPLVNQEQRASGDGTSTGDVLAVLTEVPDKIERCRRLGAVSVDAAPYPEDLYLAVIEGIVGVTTWPSHMRLAVVSANCVTGLRTGWRAEDDVSLVRAVAASCSVPGVVPPVRIEGEAYMDGGIWSASNADLLIASGVTRAVFIGPLGGPDSAELGTAKADLAAEVAAVEAAGIAILVLTPGAAWAEAIGVDVLNPALGPVAASIGFADGEAAADRVRAHLEAR